MSETIDSGRFGAILEEKSCFRTSIGGQAVIEGVMMRNDPATTGIDKFSLAVRKSDGEIELEVWENSNRNAGTAAPPLCGVFSILSACSGWATKR